MQFVRIIKKLGNAHANEHINKVGACDEKLFFIRNIGNGLFAVANGIIRTPAREQAQPSARACLCLLSTRVESMVAKDSLWGVGAKFIITKPYFPSPHRKKHQSLLKPRRK